MPRLYKSSLSKSSVKESKAENSHQPPGTMLRIVLPVGNVVNLLNFVEISSPEGACLMIRIPGPAGNISPVVATVIDSLRQAGATVEISKKEC